MLHCVIRTFVLSWPVITFHLLLLQKRQCRVESSRRVASSCIGFPPKRLCCSFMIPPTLCVCVICGFLGFGFMNSICSWTRRTLELLANFRAGSCFGSLNTTVYYLLISRGLWDIGRMITSKIKFDVENAGRDTCHYTGDTSRRK